jgi:ammonium transporter
MFRQPFLFLAALVAFTVVAHGLRADESAPPPTEKRPRNPTQKEQIAFAEKTGALPGAHDTGHTAWMLVSTGLVMLMVPGLALFYGGLARRKNLLGTMMQSMVALGVVGVLWVVVGYTLAFGKSCNGWIGWSPELLGLVGVDPGHTFTTVNPIPLYLHALYQGMFAIITPALISGALAERIRFGPYCVFIGLWSLVVYCPLAHWVWAVDLDGNPVGWLGKMGALDFAGGTVVHVAAGISSLAAILLLRKRVGYPEHAMHPNSVALALLGAGMLWFGWFGFNGGSAIGSNGLAVVALSATQIAAAAAALAWMLIEWCHRGKPTALGFATGLVAGLVGITPASGFVSPISAIIIGAATASICYVMVSLKGKFKYDDSLDAFGVHGIGGMVGAILTGVFASALMYNPDGGPKGEPPSLPAITLMGGAAPRVLVQLVAVVAAAVFAFVLTAVLIKLIDALAGGFCLDPAQETEGLDKAVHGEVGFDLGLMLEAPAEMPTQEPRPALAPPVGQKRFTVVVEGGNNGDLMHTWSGLCQVGSTPPSDEFRAVYPYLTTVQGNRFRFRGGDPDVVSTNLQKLFERRMSTPIRVRVEK